MKDALGEPDVLDVRVGGVLGAVAVAGLVALVDDDGAVDASLDEAVEGDVLDEPRAHVLARPCLDARAVLCVRHADVPANWNPFTFHQ